LVGSCGRWEHPALRTKSRRQQEVLEELDRGGEPLPTSYCGSRRLRDGPSLRVQSARAVQRCRPNDPHRKRGSGRSVARKRRYDRAMASAVMLCGVFAAPGSGKRKDCRGSQHSLFFFERGRSMLRKRSTENESDFESLRGNSKMRESEARERVRASEVKLQKSMGGDLTQRSACRCFARKRKAGRCAGTGV